MRRRPAGVALALVLCASVVLAGCLDVFEPGAKSGELAPDFEVTDLDGVTHNLTMYEGRVVVLDFMASTCGPCRVQMPYFADMLEEHPDVVLLSVSVDLTETNETLRAFAQEFNASWPFAIGGWWDVRIDYGVMTLPKIVVIDGDGIIQYATRPGTTVDKRDLMRVLDSVAGTRREA